MPHSLKSNLPANNSLAQPNTAPPKQPVSSRPGPTTLAHIYARSAQQYKGLPAFFTRQANAQFKGITFDELYEQGCRLASALIHYGLEMGANVGLLADNRVEWIISDYGILLAGGANVPRGSDVTDHDIQYIIAHADCSWVFVENEFVFSKLIRNLSMLPKLEHIVVMTDHAQPQAKQLESGGPRVHSLSQLLATGQRLRAGGDRRPEERMAAIDPENHFTIIYTSGTTGTPKGVMLTHNNILSQVRNIPVEIGPQTDRVLSILPIWHIFERVFEVVTIATGVPVYYSSVRTIREDLQTVRPTFMASAPRLWESLYGGIRTKISEGPALNRFLFSAAYQCARRVMAARQTLMGTKLDIHGRGIIEKVGEYLYQIVNLLIFFMPYWLLDAVVLRKIRQATGGAMRATISGGGALPLHVDEFFNAIGIPVLEGYGLTETSPGIAFRTPQRPVIGSVGPLLPETELRIVDLESGAVLYPPQFGQKGEIQVRGPQVMKGYYKNPQATAKVMTADGWFRTGDLGLMTYNQTLKIVGRSKETVVLSNGENVEPVPIENRLTESPFIDFALIVGQDQKQLGVLIVPNAQGMANYGANLEEIANNPAAVAFIQKEVKGLVNAAAGFKTFERIGPIGLLPKTFEAGDELSAKLSVKRHVICEKYKSMIEKMYA